MKEEPKQDLEKEMFELEQELDIPSHLRWHNSKPKQETLEEDGFTILEKKLIKEAKIVWIEQHPNPIEMALFGAKWQQEQDKKMYSEEDVKIAFDSNIKDWISFEEFIEQFKNK